MAVEFIVTKTTKDRFTLNKVGEEARPEYTKRDVRVKYISDEVIQLISARELDGSYGENLLNPNYFPAANIGNGNDGGTAFADTDAFQAWWDELSDEEGTSGGGFAYANSKSWRLTSLADVNAHLIHGSTGTIRSLFIANVGADVPFVKLYDIAAQPNPATDNASLFAVLPMGKGFTLPIPERGIEFRRGLGIALTKLGADTDATAIGAGDVYVHIEIEYN